MSRLRPSGHHHGQHVGDDGGLIGETSKGRKGTSWGHIRRLLHAVDPEWVDERIVSGLSSGEGLIWAVRDPIYKQEPIREKKIVTGYQEVMVDPGIADKRLLAMESEFAGVLRVAQRDGNPLSPVLRDAWDGGTLQTLTKNSPAKATGAHISAIGHVTDEELRKYLTATESSNGFANRFLWACVRRSKCLPEGGRISEVDFASIINRLKQAVDFARKTGEIVRDDEARQLWRDVYPELSEGKPGLWGAVTGRAEAQTARLACLYALLDCSAVVRAEHLQAALALWDYCDRSAGYVFEPIPLAGGESAEDRARQKLIGLIQRKGGAITVRDLTHGLRRFRNDAEGAETELRRLAEAGLGQWVVVPTAKRPRREFRLSPVSPSPLLPETAEIRKNGDGDSVDAGKKHKRKRRGKRKKKRR